MRHIIHPRAILAVAAAVPAGLTGVMASKCHPHPPASLSSVSWSSSSEGVYPTLSPSSEYQAVASSSTLSSASSSTISGSASASGSGSTSTETASGSASGGSSISTETASGSSSSSTTINSSTDSSATDSGSVTLSSTTTSSETTTTTDTEVNIPTSATTSSASETFDPANYSPYEVTLPVTFGSPPESTVPATSTFTLTITPTAPAACAIDQSALTREALRIGDSSGHRFMPKNGIIGVLEDSDFPSAGATEDPSGALATANEHFFDSLVFHLTSNSDPAAMGRLDLSTTVNGALVYVGWDILTFRVVTIPNRAAVPMAGGPAVVTSLFSVNCAGELEAKTPTGQLLAWKTSQDGKSTVMGPSGGTPSPIQVILASGVANTGTARRSVTARRFQGTMSSSPDLMRRMSPFTDGRYPRLPSRPGNMVARPKAGARKMASNGCGSGPLRPYTPQFGFGQCCNYHDFCFDNCATGQVEECRSGYCADGQFERCNSAFYNCMSDTVCGSISWFWHPMDRTNCEAAAVFYYGVVSTGLGGNAFDGATSERCGGYCTDTGAPFCGDVNRNNCVATTDDANCGECGNACNTGSRFNCRSNRCVCTADVLRDNNNCGGCGNKCPYKTHCDGTGSCTCDDDRCGNLCVDKKRHPRNCGACGNVCASGYCWDGKCVDPATLPTPTGPGSAPTCLPTDAVKNNNFVLPPNPADYTTPPSPWFLSSIFKSDISFNGDPSNSFVVVETYPSDPRIDRRNPQVTLAQDTTICPGKAYEFTMQVSSMQPARILISIGGRVIHQSRLSSGGDGGWTGFGPVPFTTDAASDAGPVATRLEIYIDGGMAWPLANDPMRVAMKDVSVYQA
ncbi:hypothetical protein MN608_10687 [Microdochium nivale]|nr:hypothetical protein MN608_10687 [Microdochium nivale]